MIQEGVVSPESFPFFVQPWYRKSPYYEATKRHGCRSWGLYNHMLLPTLYDDPVTEYRALVEAVTIWDVAVERCIEIAGPDAFELTNLITCRDLTKVRVGQARYVLLTAPWGGIVNDPVLLRLAEDRFWLAIADSDALLYVAGVAAGRGMDVRVRETDVAPMQVQGPRSRELVRDLLGEAVADLRYYFCAEAGARRHPARRLADRLDRGARLRAVPTGPDARRRPVRAGGGGRPPLRGAGDRAERGAPDRGGDLQLRQRHADRGHPRCTSPGSSASSSSIRSRTSSGVRCSNGSRPRAWTASSSGSRSAAIR
ncbi:MAG: hypothetical protein KatS3mg013_0155 [Actinomycetota bacterium]|nr:MAG: hypothetical protein KatS3mg013_0155 [Actinomycetota bacterium]